MMYALLCGKQAKTIYLFIASCILLFIFLGARDIWTQEHRWADIVFGMFYRQDFLHPYLGQNQYYDKPLLSYWLIVLLAKIFHGLTTWTLRLPSAMAGLICVMSVYQLGKKIKNSELGLLAGWLLITTFYFLFWARISSADMLNLAGIMAALAWYRSRRDAAGFLDYLIFFMILAVTALCKGLVGVIVPMLAVFVDVIMQNSWRRYLRLSVLFSLLPALIIYALPFWASSYYGDHSYENGLYLVYRENILRYFQPFDHKGPIYTYFLFLPIYLLPWTIFFIPALITIKSRWQRMTQDQKWLVWSFITIFIFFTVSGSRRSYYVLPLVPFAILLTADWLLALSRQKWRDYVANMIFAFFIIFLAFEVGSAWYYRQVGVARFAQVLKQEVSPIKPWQTWQVISLDAESKLNFYLELSPLTQHFGKVASRNTLTSADIIKAWPILLHKPANTIFVTRQLYVPYLEKYFKGYHRVSVPLSEYAWLRRYQMHDEAAPVAFYP